MIYVNGLVAGVVIGGGYALLAVGVSLIFATTGVLNLAHAGFAMIAAFTYEYLGTRHDWNLWLAGFVSVGAAALCGVLVERLVIRRVADAAPATKFVITLGLLSLMSGLCLQLFGFQPKGARPLFPVGSLKLGESVEVSHQQLALIVAAVGFVAALTFFLRFTRTGLAIRAVAENQTVARMMGIRRNRIAALNWGIAATLAGVSGVLIAPLSILTVATFPVLMLKAVGATLFGGISGLLGAFVGGFILGVAESLAATEFTVVGIRELTTSLIVVVLLLTRRRWPAELTSRADSGADHGSFLYPVARAALVIGLVLAFTNAASNDFWAQIGVLGLIYALVALGLVVLTGWSGQASLMSGGLMGLGGMSMALLYVEHGVPLIVAVVMGAMIAALFSGAVSLAAQRLRGLQVAIATLAVSAGISEWLLQRDEFPRVVARPDFLLEDRTIFFVLLPITAAALILVRNLRVGAWGRRLFAVRQSSETAAHFTIDPNRTRTVAFVLSGFLTGLAGCFYVLVLQGVSQLTFGVQVSISLLLYAVAAGSQSLAGPVIAGLVFAFVPQLLTKSQGGASAVPDIFSGLLIIVLMGFRPGGIATLLRRSRPPEQSSVPPAAAMRARRPARGHDMHLRRARSVNGLGADESRVSPEEVRT